MRVSARRKGFSLVELLTVIAIIAILASIIFPVMGVVGNKARMNKCITQLHEIGVAVQLFKQDNRQYPDMLFIPVQTTDGQPPASNGSNVIPCNDVQRDNSGTGLTGLFPEYTKSFKLYHCPVSKKTDTREVAYDGTLGRWFYTYNSYDYYTPPSGPPQLHYTRNGWATDPNNLPLPGPGNPAHDYERQLKFRNPPEDTVVTWCSWHEFRGGNSVTGKAPVLFLDGHVDALNADEVESQQWRVQPKKE